MTPPNTTPSASRVLTALALACALASCAPASRDATLATHGRRFFGSVEPPREDVLRFNNGAEPETIDPAIPTGQVEARVILLLFEGLTGYDPQTLAPTPGLASRWETSPDGLTCTFHLRPGLVWSDGTALRAVDFAYAWRRALAPATGSRSAALLYAIHGAEAYNRGESGDPSRVGIVAPDDSTLVVGLREPTPYFTYLTSSPVFAPVPRHVIERWGRVWTAPEHLVSNGPFRLASARHNERMVFARNPRYWDAAHVRLDGVIAYAVDDLGTSANLYKAGAIDWNPSGNIPSPFLPYFRAYSDYQTGEYQATYFYSFNVTRPPFDDARVRRALCLAVDREAISRDLLKGTRRAWGRFVPSGYPGYDAPPPQRFDPDEARRELARAGYPNGRGFPRFTLLFNTSEDHRRIAEAVQAMWRRELNVAVDLQNMENASLVSALNTLKYDVARRSWIGDYLDPTTFLGVMYSRSGSNRTGWSDPRYDALLREAGRERDAAKRLVMLAGAERILLEAAPILPIYHYSTHELVKPYVRGIHHTALDHHPLTRVWFDRGWREHEPLARSRASGARERSGGVPAATADDGHRP